MATRRKPRRKKLVRGGFKTIPINEQMHAALQKQLESFRKKFGREPGPNDPIFFDPKQDTPQPVPAGELEEAIVQAAVLSGMDGPRTYAAAYTERLVSTENSQYLTDAELEEWYNAVAEGEQIKAEKPKMLSLAVSLACTPLREKLTSYIAREAGCTEMEVVQLLDSIVQLKMMDQLETIEHFVLKNGDELREVGPSKMGKMDRISYGALCEQMGRADSPYNEFATGQRDEMPDVDDIIHEGGWYQGVADMYVTVLRSMKGAFDNEEDKDRRKHFGVVWSMLRDTNLFELPDLLYEAFLSEARSYITSMLEQQGVETDEDGAPNTVEGMEIYHSAALQVPMPEKLPFPSCYFGYDPPVELEEHDWVGYGLDELNREIIRAFLVGHLITRKRGFAFIMVESDTFGILPVEVRKDEEWKAITFQEPWVLTSILEWINDHVSVLEESSRKQKKLLDGLRNLERALKMKRRPPPPYYTVYMRDSYRRQINTIYQARRKTKVEWQHRWAVRGHHMIRIRRGPLPIDPALREKLIDRKYRVFATDPPDAETAQHLARRRVPAKKADEWMAVLVSWRSEHVKGPEWAPFIPAIRKSARVTKVEKEAMKRAMKP